MKPLNSLVIIEKMYKEGVVASGMGNDQALTLLWVGVDEVNTTGMFESVVTAVLNKFLGDYVANLEQNQLNLGIFSGIILND